MARRTFDWPPTDNQFDIRDVIARFEEIEDSEDAEEIAERTEIANFLEEVKGNGGDERWRGDWYPVGFIADHYFEDYAQELAEDCGRVNEKATWPNDYIDWKRAAKALQGDYSSIEIGSVTYWYQ